MSELPSAFATRSEARWIKDMALRGYQSAQHPELKSLWDLVHRLARSLEEALPRTER